MTAFSDGIDKALASPGPGDEPRRTRQAPPGWEPGYTWDGARGALTTAGLAEQPKTWDAFILDAGLDPADVCVVGPVQVRGWDAPKAGGDVVRMHYYRLTLGKRENNANIDELIKLVANKRPRKVAPVDDGSAFVFAAGDLQLGKALSDDTPILTTEGWTKHGAIRPGDFVYGPHGRPVEVLAVTGSTLQALYDVEFDQGVHVVATADHRWDGYRVVKNKGASYCGYSRQPRSMTTAQLAAMPRNATRKGTEVFQHPFHVDLPQPLEMPAVDLPIEPYILGLWLADGNSHNGYITEGVEDAEWLSQFGYFIPSNCNDRHVGINVPGLAKLLRKVGLIQNKHMPEVYMHGSVAQRLALLQGLMDGDGGMAGDSHGGAEFSNTNYAITDAVEWLLTSLGYKYHTADAIGMLNGVAHKPYRRITFRPIPEVPPFRLPRKLAYIQHEAIRPENRYRYVRSVTTAGEGSAQCLTVEGGLYLAGHDLVVTHNCDGDGAAGTVDRYLQSVDRSVDRLKMLRKASAISQIHIGWLGDCIEGFVSQGGANAWRTSLTLTEQLRLLRRLMLHTIQAFAPLAERLTVTSVPGNHDQTIRFGGKGLTRYDDSYAVDALVAVGDALAMNADAYGHVQLFTPGRDELTVTIDVAGTVITHAHGHQFRRGKHMDWWRGQAFGDHPAGAAHMLLAGHLHHLHVDTSSKRTFVQVPSLESESTWYRHGTGEVGNPGVVTLVTRDGGWSEMSVV